jgi:hypothetical protein
VPPPALPELPASPATCPAAPIPAVAAPPDPAPPPAALSPAEPVLPAPPAGAPPELPELPPPPCTSLVCMPPSSSPSLQAQMPSKTNIEAHRSDRFIAFPFAPSGAGTASSREPSAAASANPVEDPTQLCRGDPRTERARRPGDEGEWHRKNRRPEDGNPFRSYALPVKSKRGDTQSRLQSRPRERSDRCVEVEPLTATARAPKAARGSCRRPDRRD